MEILQMVVEISNMSVNGIFKPPLASTEISIVSLIRLKERFTYRFTTIFFVIVANSDSSFEFSFEIDVLTDFLFTCDPVQSSDLYSFYALAFLAVKKQVDKKLLDIGISDTVTWPSYPPMILEKKLDEAILVMLHKEINKNPN